MAEWVLKYAGPLGVRSSIRLPKQARRRRLRALLPAGLSHRFCQAPARNRRRGGGRRPQEEDQPGEVPDLQSAVRHAGSHRPADSQSTGSFGGVVRVQRTEHAIQAHIVSLQYNGSPVMAAESNQEGFEFALRNDGSFEQLTQQMDIGQDNQRRQVTAQLDDENNQTVIVVHYPEPEARIVKPGLVLLKVSTSKRV